MSTNRCNHCEYRYSWLCEEFLVHDGVMCDNFKLDFDSLSNKQQNAIQKRLMREGKESEEK